MTELHRVGHPADRREAEPTLPKSRVVGAECTITATDGEPQ